MRQFLSELEMRDNAPTKLFCDTKSSIKLVRNPIMHARTKHIKLEHHYIKEMTQA